MTRAHLVRSRRVRRKKDGRQLVSREPAISSRAIRESSRQLSRVGPDERGGGTMLMVGIMTVVVMVSLTGVCIAGYLVAVHRVRAAADLAALSGASALVANEDGCAAARRNARSNHAHVIECERVGDAIDFVITVRAEVNVNISVPGLPRRISAVAYAGSGAD